MTPPISTKGNPLGIHIVNVHLYGFESRIAREWAMLYGKEVTN